MRKQTKLVAVLSAAALLAIGASMTSFAAGWTEEDGTWVYLDRDDYRVTDSWRKSGDYWYYLDEDGYMATSQLVENTSDSDDIYYVDETGRMVTNRWVELENEDYYDSGDDEEPETVWYYFQNSGKAYKTSGATSFKTINGQRYAFDADGQMLFGWVDEQSNRVTGDDAYQEGTYYCGDANDGARVSGDWRYLYISQDGPDSEDDNYWFYFGSNGKKIVNNNNRTINGRKYAFDENGVMISDWHEASVTVASAITGYYGDENDGSRKSGWFEVVPSENVDPDNYNDDEAKWFYANNNGTLVVSQLKTINGKKYAFDENGEMLSGLYMLEVDNSNNITDYEKINEEDEVENIATMTDGEDQFVYYFGDSDDGAMKTGNQNVTVDGETYQFSFERNGSNKGAGVNGAQNNVLYVNGKRIKADSDYRYQPVAADGTVVDLPVLSRNDDGEWIAQVVADADYLINASGSIMRGSGTYTDSDGRQFTVTREGEAYVVTFAGWRD